MIRTPEDALKWRERVDINFDGYNESRWELFEVSEVRDFVDKLDEHFPYWLFFLAKSHFGLQCVMLCFLPPFLTPEGKASTFPERINMLLENRWFPAMNHICNYVGMSEIEIMKMTDRVVDYLRAS